MNEQQEQPKQQQPQQQQQKKNKKRTKATAETDRIITETASNKWALSTRGRRIAEKGRRQVVDHGCQWLIDLIASEITTSSHCHYIGYVDNDYNNIQ